VQLDVLERLPRASERDLALGGAVGVVERGSWRPALGEGAQVLDRERGGEPAAAARRVSSYEISRSRMTYSWNQLRPCGLVAFTVSMELVPSVDSVNGMPAAPAAVAPAISPSVCMRRVNPVGAMPNGRADGPPRICTEVSTVDAGRRMPGWNSMSSNA